MSVPMQGQCVYRLENGVRVAGKVLRRQGAGHVMVSVVRERLKMAGTFPDRPIGTERRACKECWSIASLVPAELALGSL